MLVKRHDSPSLTTWIRAGMGKWIPGKLVLSWVVGTSGAVDPKKIVGGLSKNLWGGTQMKARQC